MGHLGKNDAMKNSLYKSGLWAILKTVYGMKLSYKLGKSRTILPLSVSGNLIYSEHKPK